MQTLDGDSSQRRLRIGEGLCLAVTVYVIINHVNTLRTGDADLLLYITTVQDG